VGRCNSQLAETNTPKDCHGGSPVLLLRVSSTWATFDRKGIGIRL